MQGSTSTVHKSLLCAGWDIESPVQTFVIAALIDSILYYAWSPVHQVPFIIIIVERWHSHSSRHDV
jgi:hypothetical protein